ncbi:copper amine oxidase N-terminal domain-containing protein [Pelotomaculum terephthalicicum JT]|uniref:copper amine oxidase N-terminal domain-containing protein n=1 Tax=Pelotomaculum TaxID=191373 RepID=UPI0009D02C55|nr:MULTISPECIES: copper amine oxidase N-terminal domain-containing protein [Pelotomaculum]MCG9968030.1 copper amine oxidase N-terminal domain-containing protein [Pelotomaculum terephthalicicum JT]OPX88201.1 MAG: hypothetical protein A4E54_01366 [Pelotomaculum sp. PtaB.Bin117]OPY60928.1 MAG: hypothetical protein A4E56_02390 [Pelotomaculum sp. PtaU1.Bin065]
MKTKSLADSTITQVSARGSTARLYIGDLKMGGAGYHIGGSNYLKLHDIARMLNLGVVWDGRTNTVLIDTTSDFNPSSDIK